MFVLSVSGALLSVCFVCVRSATICLFCLWQERYYLSVLSVSGSLLSVCFVCDRSATICLFCLWQERYSLSVLSVTGALLSVCFVCDRSATICLFCLCQERYYLSVADLVCVTMLLSATSSGVREMVVFHSRGDVKCKSLFHHCWRMSGSVLFHVQCTLVQSASVWTRYIVR